MPKNIILIVNCTQDHSLSEAALNHFRQKSDNNLFTVITLENAEIKIAQENQSHINEIKNNIINGFTTNIFLVTKLKDDILTKKEQQIKVMKSLNNLNKIFDSIKVNISLKERDLLKIY